MPTLALTLNVESGAHHQRVQHYARTLAERLAGDPHLADEIDNEFIRLIFSASILHDLGKVAIPSAILDKPARLTDEEFEIVKAHTSIGAAAIGTVLEQSPGVRFLRMARDIARFHHERWDGHGYPDGLAGEQIPLAARIVAVADVYDALVSARSYKPAFSHAAARATIAKESGRRFDPRIVRAFLATGDEFDAVRTSFMGAAPLLAAA